MINVYKNRVIFFLFGIILIINTVLMSLVFFAFSSIIKRDYAEKLTSVANQTSANANGILSFFEEEIEVFINKYNVEESIDTFKLEAPNFIRMDSTSFEDHLIFKGSECVYASDLYTADFYKEMLLEIMPDITDKNWYISEKKNKIISSRGTLIYVRTLFAPNTNKKVGCVMAAVSQTQLAKLLNLSLGMEFEGEKEFLPHSVGICADDKILFLGENSQIIPKTDDMHVGDNEMYVINSIEGKEFFTLHNTKILDNKILVVFILFVLLFAVITFFSYRILKFMVNEICMRIDNLNQKIEMYSPSGEDKSL